MAYHHEVGKKGETLAAAFLAEHQYRILAVNWQWGRLEIDIVAQKNDTLVFVEVKTRSSSAFGWPEEAVHHQKRELLLRAAEAYMEQYNTEPANIRFDIISITLHPQLPPAIFHFEDAF
jgi:putative endonuclease